MVTGVKKQFLCRWDRGEGETMGGWEGGTMGLRRSANPNLKLIRLRRAVSMQ